MSLSPARQHRLRVQAEQAAREGGSVRHASGYDLMLLQLAEDRRRLKGVQSTVKKAEIKVELLPKYAAWAEGVLTAGGAQQDDVLMYVMLWRIDAGDYAGALEIGRHALRHGWVMPLGNRNVQTVLAEEMADAAQSNAERAAKMQWERLQRGVASFSLQLAEGRADLYTEMPVKVSGFKQPIDDAEWTITTLTHTVSPDNGFTTSLELEVRIDDFEME